jgi:hypothetical protein
MSAPHGFLFHANLPLETAVFLELDLALLGDLGPGRRIGGVVHRRLQSTDLIRHLLELATLLGLEILELLHVHGLGDDGPDDLHDVAYGNAVGLMVGIGAEGKAIIGRRDGEVAALFLLQQEGAGRADMIVCCRLGVYGGRKRSAHRHPQAGPEQSVREQAFWCLHGLFLHWGREPRLRPSAAWCRCSRNILPDDPGTD